ncbi:DUF521 domain-containing protein [Paraburkholderia sp. Cy-641]|uniref:aconitase X n=1 Tax=Paraburkholderia sp. Cy-641 TaxID=2608337 RepID=UPI00141F7224|nr:aconitase X catalytic domain-containing protein [Paraburkholderia sp. Cy-641]NIF77839.1 DUF521 domain-containing protein [Paraburkholderia sp. Cy-641]
MKLTDEEIAMLNGEHGEVMRVALKMQVEVGEYFGAEDMVKISSVHASGDVEELGLAGVEYLEQVARSGARCAVKAVTDPRGYAFEPRCTLKQLETTKEIETRTVAAFEKIGLLNCSNCIVYQTTLQPYFGEHVAWGDTGSVIYANSVFGARSNYESGPAALAASLTGRVPRYGFHLDECRKANVVVHVEDQPKELADWGALGCCVGRQLNGYWDVPVFEGLTSKPDSDALKHLGAALASYGSAAMFHIVGVTPEARSLEAAMSTQREIRHLQVPEGALDSVYHGWSGDFTEADLVVFSAPQLSLFEIVSIAEALEGKKVHPTVKLIVTTNSQIAASTEQLGIRARLEASGAELIAGVCFYLMTPRQLSELNGFSRLVTNSAKLANIMAGQGYQVKFRRFDDCIRAATLGTLA